jgi:hypothetical protein
MLQEVRVFASLLHAHYAGRQIKTDIVRNGTVIGALNRNDNYDFAFQNFDFFPEEKVIKAGDLLKTTCTYRTRERPGITLGGLSTHDEMCLNYMYYYPKEAVSGCMSLTQWVDTKGTKDPYNEDGSVYWTGVLVNFIKMLVAATPNTYDVPKIIRDYLTIEAKLESDQYSSGAHVSRLWLKDLFELWNITFDESEVYYFKKAVNEMPQTDVCFRDDSADQSHSQVKCAQDLWDGGCNQAGPCYQAPVCSGGIMHTDGAFAACSGAKGVCDSCFPESSCGKQSRRRQSCTMDQVVGANSAPNQTVYVMNLLTDVPKCGQCLVGCSQSTSDAAGMQACAFGCTHAPPAPAPACTMAEMTNVATAADKTAAVIGLMSSNAPCGQCLMGCASAADATACAMAACTSTSGGKGSTGTGPESPSSCPAMCAQAATC